MVAPSADVVPMRDTREVEREHLYRSIERQVVENRVWFMVMFAVKILLIAWTGWIFVAGAAVGAAVHRVAQMRVRSWEHPQRTLLQTWMVFLAITALGGFFIPDTPLWALSRYRAS